MTHQNDKKTIWIFNQFAGTPSSGSGSGERHYYFSRYWVSAGHRVVVFSGSFNHIFKNLPVTNGTYTSEFTDGVEFCWVKVPKYNPETIIRFWSMLVFAWRLLWVDRQKFGKPDTILVSSMPIFPISSALVLRLMGKCGKVIFEIRDIWPLSLQYLADVSKWHPAVVFIGWFEKIGYKFSDHVVSLLPNARQHIEGVADKIVSFHYIPNGIEEELLQDDPLEEEITRKIPPGKFIVGYAGTIALANALETFVEAAVKLRDNKNIHFVLVGDGYLKTKLVEMAQRTDNITFIGKIRKNQVQNMLRHFDVCFVGRHNSPLFKHGVSANKYFDYMLAGKPVLDANNLIKDPVELSGCGIIVEPESVDALCEGVLKLHGMPKSELNKMGNLGKEYVRINHSIKVLSLRYLDII
jgi:hypothetical protein